MGSRESITNNAAMERISRVRSMSRFLRSRNLSKRADISVLSLFPMRLKHLRHELHMNPADCFPVNPRNLLNAPNRHLIQQQRLNPSGGSFGDSRSRMLQRNLFRVLSAALRAAIPMAQKTELLTDALPNRDVLQLLVCQLANLHLPAAVRASDIRCPLPTLEHEDGCCSL